MNNYRFPDNGIERKINITADVIWDNIGRDDSIDIFEREVLEIVKNPIEDVELGRFEHEVYDLTKTSLNYDFYFMPNQIDITAATTSDYSVNYTAETFTTTELYVKSNSFKRSFFKLDLYDTPIRSTQQIKATIILPTQQGKMVDTTMGQGNTQKNIKIVTPSMMLDYVGDKEGFFIYWVKDRGYIDINNFYMSAKFFNGKTGEFTRMLNTPQTNMGNLFNFKNEDKYYYRVFLDYDNYEFKITTTDGLQRVGTTTNPINWYQYTNL